MEIILRADVQNLGKTGDVVKVKDGYARNYLLPKGLAYLATEANKKRIVYEAERLAKQRAAPPRKRSVSYWPRLPGRRAPSAGDSCGRSRPSPSRRPPSSPGSARLHGE